jgi:hypothetical protein
MSRRAVGFGFCAIAAFFFGLRYLIAALLFVGMQPGEVNTDTLDLFLTYTGDTLVRASILALIVGVAFLIWAEIDARRGHGA